MIGVALCTCGGTLSKKIDFEKLKKFAENLEDVTIVEVFNDLCKNTVEKLHKFKGLKGVIFGCCSEKNSLTFSEERISSILSSLEIDKSMFEVVNLREQCVWIHDGDLTGKAIDQLNMAYVKLKTNLESYKYKPKEKVLIIGGGVTGLSCALSLKKLGIDFTLVERDHYLGGKAIQTSRVWQSEGYPSTCTTACSVLHLVKNVWYECKDNILINSEVLEIRKENGNFKAKIVKKAEYVDPEKCIGCGKCIEVCPVTCDNPFNFGFTQRKAIDKDYKTAVPDIVYIDERSCNKCGECVEVCPVDAINLDAQDEIFEDEFGAIVIATGFEEKKIEVGDKVVTFMQLERLIENKIIPKSVIFVMCTKSDYCSRLCCPIAIKLANFLAGICDVTVIYDELVIYGRAFETFRKQALKKGVKFVKAKVKEVKNGTVLTDVGEFKADLIALAEGFVPAETRIVESLGVVTDEYGYPIEFQPRVVNPLETHVERVFVAGCAKGFKDIQESVESGHAVAVKVYDALKSNEKKFYSITDLEKCSRCGLCSVVCPHGAIIYDGIYKILPELCRGCGLCYATCPSRAIRLINMEDYQILKMAEVAFNNCDGKRVLALLCYWCSYTACDKMGLYGLKVPSNVRTIRVRCSASVNPEVVLEILERGLADYVLVAGCPPKNCHHLWGNYMENNRFKMVSKILKELGIEEKCRYEYIGVSAWAKLCEILSNLCK